MKSSELLADALGRIGETVSGVLTDLEPGKLNWRPGGSGNSISWLVWHLSRVEDHHIADLAGVEQRWTADDFVGRFGFTLKPADTGYGHNTDQVAAVRVQTASLLLEYHQAVLRQSLDYVQGLDGEDFDKIVDTRWDPPVTQGVRLVSVIDDCMQHAGQASYVRGLQTQ